MEGQHLKHHQKIPVCYYTIKKNSGASQFYKIYPHIIFLSLTLPSVHNEINLSPFKKLPSKSSKSSINFLLSYRIVLNLMHRYACAWPVLYKTRWNCSHILGLEVWPTYQSLCIYTIKILYKSIRYMHIYICLKQTPYIPHSKLCIHMYTCRLWWFPLAVIPSEEAYQTEACSIIGQA